MNFFDSWLEQFVTEHPDVTSDIAELKAAMTAGKASIQQEQQQQQQGMAATTAAAGGVLTHGWIR